MIRSEFEASSNEPAPIGWPSAVAVHELSPNTWWGMAGGIAVAGAIDAVWLHDERSTWHPTVTPSEDGARLGLATTV